MQPATRRRVNIYLQTNIILNELSHKHLYTNKHLYERWVESLNHVFEVK